MDRRTRIPFAGLLVLLGLLLFAIPVSADGFQVDYCATQNTAKGNAMTDDFQSNGWCTDRCRSSAFAVILGKSCWCSDYAPGDGLQRTGECSDDCFGYPSEKCGNEARKYYIYIKGVGGVSPSGTQGASKPTSTSKPALASPSSDSATRTSQAPERVSQTLIGKPEEVTFTRTPSSASTLSTTFQTSTPAPTTPQTSTRTLTQSGVTSTETIITTPSAQPIQHQDQGSSKGAIIGGAVGGFFGLAAVAGVAVFVLFRRRKQPVENDDENGVHRNVSTLSRSGLLRTEKKTYPPPIVTNVSTSRQSRNLDQESISPISVSDRRGSRHMTDQRLNPNALFVFENSSTGSVGTIDDSRDYNRTLNVRNPDP